MGGRMQNPLAIREGLRHPQGAAWLLTPYRDPPLLPLLGVGEELGCWAPGPRRAEQVALGQGRGEGIGGPPSVGKGLG